MLFIVPLQQKQRQSVFYEILTYGVFTPEQDNDKTNVEPVHSYDAFHTGPATTGVKGIVGMHRFNICLVVVLSLSCSGATQHYSTSKTDILAS